MIPQNQADQMFMILLGGFFGICVGVVILILKWFVIDPFLHKRKK